MSEGALEAILFSLSDAMGPYQPLAHDTPLSEALLRHIDVRQFCEMAL
jgi:hypothetical protein